MGMLVANAIQWPLIAGFPHFWWPRVVLESRVLVESGKSGQWCGPKGVEIEWSGDDNDNAAEEVIMDA